MWVTIAQRATLIDALGKELKSVELYVTVKFSDEQVFDDIRYDGYQQIPIDLLLEEKYPDLTVLHPDAVDWDFDEAAETHTIHTYEVPCDYDYVID